MTHDTVEAAIAKAELSYFRTHPGAAPGTIVKSAVVNGTVHLYGTSNKILAVYLVFATRCRLSVEEEKGKQ